MHEILRIECEYKCTNIKLSASTDAKILQLSATKKAQILNECEYTCSLYTTVHYTNCLKHINANYTDKSTISSVTGLV